MRYICVLLLYMYIFVPGSSMRMADLINSNTLKYAACAVIGVHIHKR